MSAVIVEHSRSVREEVKVPRSTRTMHHFCGASKARAICDWVEAAGSEGPSHSGVFEKLDMDVGESALSILQCFEAQAWDDRNNSSTYGQL